MNMVSMANKPKQEETEGDKAVCCDDMKYPYGTQISLCDDQLEALGITDLPKVGTVVNLMASAKVVSVRAEEGQDGESERSLQLQITDLGIDSRMTETKKASTMFDNSKED